MAKHNEPLFYPAWCLESGEVRVGLGDYHEDAYDHYCSNPHGFTPDQLAACQWRGVMKLGELMDAIAAVR